MDNMTAIVSCFSRAYHYKNNSEWVFKDEMAEQLLTKKEYNTIAFHMMNGISYFSPTFTGTKKEALRFIIDHQLSPSVLIRSAFNETALENAVLLGCRQYVLFASGYDSYALRTKSKELHVYELDLPQMIADKRKRIFESKIEEKCHTTYIPCDLSKNSWIQDLMESGFEYNKPSFGSLLGISYYLKKEDFLKLLSRIARVWCEGSAICFDYPTIEEGVQSIQNHELALEAGEEMKAKYSYEEMETMLSEIGFLIYEHLDHTSATNRFCKQYNTSHPNHTINSPLGVHYCLAVKKG